MKAQGEAEAIRQVQQATADALKMLNEANPNEQVVKIKALEAFEAAADGKATKIIIPSELQGLAGLVASAKTVWDSGSRKTNHAKDAKMQVPKRDTCIFPEFLSKPSAERFSPERYPLVLFAAAAIIITKEQTQNQTLK